MTLVTCFDNANKSKSLDERYNMNVSLEVSWTLIENIRNRYVESEEHIPHDNHDAAHQVQCSRDTRDTPHVYSSGSW